MFLNCDKFQRTETSHFVFSSNGVIDLVKKIKSQNNKIALPTADSFGDSDIFQKDTDVKPLMEVIKKRENEIKIAEPDVDTFMINMFSKRGVKNIFGKAKDI